MNRICVFCGSSFGDSPAFTAVARELGSELGNRGLGLVYGGSGIGLMGETAKHALFAGSEVIGVIPEAIHRRVTPLGGISLEVVPDMHRRKMRMYELADAFIALPGGIGTLEELMEVLTWLQLGYHHKAVALLNVESFYDPLLAMLDQMVERGFLKQDHRDNLITGTQAGAILTSIEKGTVSSSSKWS